VPDGSGRAFAASFELNRLLARHDEGKCDGKN
jgi:hypothetical protein